MSFADLAEESGPQVGSLPGLDMSKLIPVAYDEDEDGVGGGGGGGALGALGGGGPDRRLESALDAARRAGLPETAAPSSAAGAGSEKRLADVEVDAGPAGLPRRAGGADGAAAGWGRAAGEAEAEAGAALGGTLDDLLAPSGPPAGGSLDDRVDTSSQPSQVSQHSQQSQQVPRSRVFRASTEDLGDWGRATSSSARSSPAPQQSAATGAPPPRRVFGTPSRTTSPAPPDSLPASASTTPRRVFGVTSPPATPPPSTATPPPPTPTSFAPAPTAAAASAAPMKISSEGKLFIQLGSSLREQWFVLRENTLFRFKSQSERANYLDGIPLDTPGTALTILGRHRNRRELFGFQLNCGTPKTLSLYHHWDVAHRWISHIFANLTQIEALRRIPRRPQSWYRALGPDEIDALELALRALVFPRDPFRNDEASRSDLLHALLLSLHADPHSQPVVTSMLRACFQPRVHCVLEALAGKTRAARRDSLEKALDDGDLDMSDEADFEQAAMSSHPHAISNALDLEDWLRDGAMQALTADYLVTDFPQRFDILYRACFWEANVELLRATRRSDADLPSRFRKAPEIETIDRMAGVLLGVFGEYYGVSLPHCRATATKVLVDHFHPDAGYLSLLSEQMRAFVDAVAAAPPGTLSNSDQSDIAGVVRSIQRQLRIRLETFPSEFPSNQPAGVVRRLVEVQQLVVTLACLGKVDLQLYPGRLPKPTGDPDQDFVHVARIQIQLAMERAWRELVNAVRSAAADAALKQGQPAPDSSTLGTAGTKTMPVEQLGELLKLLEIELKDMLQFADAYPRSVRFVQTAFQTMCDLAWARTKTVAEEWAELKQGEPGGAFAVFQGWSGLETLLSKHLEDVPEAREVSRLFGPMFSRWVAETIMRLKTFAGQACANATWEPISETTQYAGLVVDLFTAFAQPWELVQTVAAPPSAEEPSRATLAELMLQGITNVVEDCVIEISVQCKQNLNELEGTWPEAELDPGALVAINSMDACRMQLFDLMGDIEYDERGYLYEEELGDTFRAIKSLVQSTLDYLIKVTVREHYKAQAHQVMAGAEELALLRLKEGRASVGDSLTNWTQSDETALSDVMDPVLEEMSPLMQLLHEMLAPDLFQKAIRRMWDSLIDVYCSSVQSGAVQSQQAEAYKIMDDSLRIWFDFFHAGGSGVSKEYAEKSRAASTKVLYDAEVNCYEELGASPLPQAHTGLLNRVRMMGGGGAGGAGSSSGAGGSSGGAGAASKRATIDLSRLSTKIGEGWRASVTASQALKERLKAGLAGDEMGEDLDEGEIVVDDDATSASTSDQQRQQRQQATAPTTSGGSDSTNKSPTPGWRRLAKVVAGERL